jgi:hypothetical protein
MARSQRGPMKAQRRLGLVLSWPWLTAVFLVDVAVLVLASHVPGARIGVAIAGGGPPSRRRHWSPDPFRRSMTEDALAETCSGCTSTRVGWSL